MGNGYLRTKSIHSPVSTEDGYRISIMSRHTLNDGLTPDSLITLESYDEWRPSLAPPNTLIGSYYKRGLSWEEFASSYVEFLRTPETQVEVKKLIELSKIRVVTLLCVEDTPEHCHRRLLLEECQRMDSGIEILIA